MGAGGERFRRLLPRGVRGLLDRGRSSHLGLASVCLLAALVALIAGARPVGAHGNGAKITTDTCSAPIVEDDLINFPPFRFSAAEICGAKNLENKAYEIYAYSH